MYNRELQIIDTQEKAYILGMFYADGNVGSTKIQSRIVLKDTDKNLIFQLHSIFTFFNIYEYKNKHQFELNSGNKLLYKDLINNGCLPRKSFENRFNIHLPLLQNDLISHFIRGYYDGNGGCTVSQLNSNRKTQKRVYIYSVSESFLYEIQSILSTNNIISIIRKNHKTGRSIKLYILSISTKSYKKFFDYIYNTPNIFMERKKNKLEFIINNTTFFIRKKSIPCIYCGSNNTVCDGHNHSKDKKQRYLCKDCKKTFTAPLNSNIQSGEDELLEG